MLSLVLAVLTANPCMAPIKHHHHAKPEPVQSCVAPLVPMCFKDPVPDPDLQEIPNVLPYYITVPDTDDEPEGEGGPYIETTESLPAVYPYGPGVYVSTGAPALARAPEIQGAGAPAALTLLLGGVAVLAGRRQ